MGLGGRWPPASSSGTLLYATSIPHLSTMMLRQLGQIIPDFLVAVVVPAAQSRDVFLHLGLVFKDLEVSRSKKS